MTVPTETIRSRSFVSRPRSRAASSNGAVTSCASYDGARAEPDLAYITEEGGRRHRAGAHGIAGRLAALDALDPGIDIDAAADHDRHARRRTRRTRARSRTTASISTQSSTGSRRRPARDPAPRRAETGPRASDAEPATRPSVLWSGSDLAQRPVDGGVQRARVVTPAARDERGHLFLAELLGEIDPEPRVRDLVARDDADVGHEPVGDARASSAASAWSTEPTMTASWRIDVACTYRSPWSRIR